LRDFIWGALHIDVNYLEAFASDRVAWRPTLKAQLPGGEANWKEKCDVKRARKKAKATACDVPQTVPSTFICSYCGGERRAFVGLFSHSRKCEGKAKMTNNYLLLWSVTTKFSNMSYIP